MNFIFLVATGMIYETNEKEVFMVPMGIMWAYVELKNNQPRLLALIPISSFDS